MSNYWRATNLTNCKFSIIQNSTFDAALNRGPRLLKRNSGAYSKRNIKTAAFIRVRRLIEDSRYITFYTQSNSK